MNEAGLDPAALDAAARLAGEADALLVCAGAGMGVDSGLPDFRGDAGFNWGERLPHGVRVFTSNVDGQFQRAGFDGVAEAHGSIHHLQCLRPCSDDVWPAGDVEVDVDADTMRAVPPLPPPPLRRARPPEHPHVHGLDVDGQAGRCPGT
jgi:NAD-dependent SIR2 family protein deacetylase